ncbi:MAG: hypothetical protein DRR06_18355 [Gammaproteobacteria bacterium]|nr:MAG: hypothetical protein DRR06_18355 [Gammaproteobacteria bacterium]
MRRALVVLLIGLFVTPALALESPWEQKLPFESATINYDITGLTSGSKTIFVKDFGRTSVEYRETVMKILGMKQEQKEFILTTPDWEYTADLVANTGTKHANLTKFLTQEFNNLSREDQKKVIENAEKQGITMIKDMNGSFEKNAAEILGYSCDKATVMGTVVYTIHGSELSLKIESNTMGMKFNEIATSIKKGRVDSSKFELPANINFRHDKEADQMGQTQAKTIIEHLVSGEPIITTAGATPKQQGLNNQEKQNQSNPEQQLQFQNIMKMFGGKSD